MSQLKRIMLVLLTVVLVTATATYSAGRIAYAQSWLTNEYQREPATKLVNLSGNSSKNSSCDLRQLAQNLALKQNSQEVLNCYWTLNDQQKLTLMPVVAKEAGISMDEINRDRDNMRRNVNSQRSLSDIPLKFRPNKSITSPLHTSGSGSWRQWLERVPFSAVFATTVSAGGSWRSQYWCDAENNDPDNDAIFVYYFSSSVSNPDALRSFGTLQYPLVDLMLTYYGFGVNGEGYTWSSTVYVCVGETSVNWLGMNYIYNGLKLYR